MAQNSIVTPFADIINVINSNSGEFVDAISHDLSYFYDEFIASGFVTRSTTTEISTTRGIGNREKASQLLDAVITNYEITSQKQDWVDKFVAVFSSKAAYKGLALMLTGEPDPPGIVIQNYCTLYFIQFCLLCVVWIML